MPQELDRQQARKLVKQDTDREMQEFQMTVHRINKVLGLGYKVFGLGYKVLGS